MILSEKLWNEKKWLLGTPIFKVQKKDMREILSYLNTEHQWAFPDLVGVREYRAK